MRTPMRTVLSTVVEAMRTPVRTPLACVGASGIGRRRQGEDDDASVCWGQR